MKQYWDKLINILTVINEELNHLYDRLFPRFKLLYIILLKFNILFLLIFLGKEIFILFEFGLEEKLADENFRSEIFAIFLPISVYLITYPVYRFFIMRRLKSALLKESIPDTITSKVPEDYFVLEKFIFIIAKLILLFIAILFYLGIFSGNIFLILRLFTNIFN